MLSFKYYFESTLGLQSSYFFFFSFSEVANEEQDLSEASIIFTNNSLFFTMFR